MVDKRLDKCQRMAKGDKSLASEIAFLQRVKETLDAGKPVRSMEMNTEEQAMIQQIFLLTTKPVIYAANMDESAFQKYETQNLFYQKLIHH